MREEQTKKQAAKEIVITRIIGFTVAIFTAELFVYDMFGLTVAITQNLGLGIYWSFQSILVGYACRRFFETRAL